MRNILVLLLAFLLIRTIDASDEIPFSTNSDFLTVWNGSEYVPIFIKGINLGIAIPGTFPGEMAASKSDYAKWFRQIKEAGFNCIRLYTLHYPRFFEVLDSFNHANKGNPLYFFQGVWLEEELPGYQHDLYFLNSSFKKEIEENIDCVHGNKIIAERFGKASGTYSVNVSEWCLGYIIGREVHPIEVLTTNMLNSSFVSFKGDHLAIENASPTEVFFINMLDHVISHEYNNYKTMRPVSNSSWPSIDPIHHAEEPNRDEDTAQLNLSKLEVLNAPAGVFFSYHAYPYYPDFISRQSSYKQYSDDYGFNSYLGYLHDLKAHYKNFPLIIAEYGVPSSWVVAHYASNGMNHGGYDEYQQGLINLRLLDNIRASSCGGGIQFAWIDEWFKKTWVTDAIDYNPESRVVWHNYAAAEQNFGLLSYSNTLSKDTILKNASDKNISYIKAETNYAFFDLEIGLKNPMDIPDEMWIALDTYDAGLGEIMLPNGRIIPTGAEFFIHLTNYKARLFVTQAYDIFGIYHGWSAPEQLYRSIPSQGAPWNIMRVRNNSYYEDVQYIGNLQVNYDFQPLSTKDAVIISNGKIQIKLPYSYLLFTEPNRMKVFHDNRQTVQKEDTISDGIAVHIDYKNEWSSSTKRYVWENWNKPVVNEKLKTSYYVMKDNLHKFNSPAIAVRDSFHFSNEFFPVTIAHDKGLLSNDFDMDGEVKVSLIAMNPRNGIIYLYNDGSFQYTPQAGFIGFDSMQYFVYDGYSLSKENTVIFYVADNNHLEEIKTAKGDDLFVYPNPVQEILYFKSNESIEYAEIFDTSGINVTSFVVGSMESLTNISEFKPGRYVLLAHVNGKILKQVFVKI